MSEYISLLPRKEDWISQEDACERLEDIVLQIEAANDMDAALQIHRKITNLISGANIDPSKKKQFDILLARLQLVRFVLFDTKEMAELFDNYLIDFFRSEDVNLIDRFDAAVLHLMDPFFAQQLTYTILDVLIQCTAEIGVKVLNIEEGDKRPTIGGWTHLINASLPQDRVPGRIDIVQFLTENNSVKSLSQEDKRILERFIDFYLHVRFPEEKFRPDVLTKQYEELDYLPEASEAVEAGVIRAVKQSPVLRAQTSQAIRQNPKDIFRFWYNERKDQLEQIYKSESEVLKEIQEKREKVREVLWDAASAKDLVKSMAALKVLAKMGALQEIFTREDVVELFSPYIERKFGQAARMSFAKNPNRPQYVTALLRYVLEEKLGLSENEASLWAMLVLRLLETQDPAYARAVFFDEKSGGFKWNPEMSAVGIAK